jgi:hypothetical protein
MKPSEQSWINRRLGEANIMLLRSGDEIEFKGNPYLIDHVDDEYVYIRLHISQIFDRYYMEYKVLKRILLFDHKRYIVYVDKPLWLCSICTGWI